MSYVSKIFESKIKKTVQCILRFVTIFFAIKTRQSEFFVSQVVFLCFLQFFVSFKNQVM